MKTAIVVFARAPVPGKVKTRLAQQIGDENAARLYRAMLRDTIAVARRAAKMAEDCEVVIAFTPDDAFDEGAHSLAPLWSGARLAQRGDDLGERLLCAINDARSAGAENVIVIGSDSPDLPTLPLALERLTNCEVIFGPAHDGGFYLIGASRALPATIFDGVIWSSSLTLGGVLENARRLNLNRNILREWPDVDTFDDLQTLQERLESGVSKALATAKVLRELKRGA